MAEALLNLADVQVRRGMNTVLKGCSLSLKGGQVMVLTAPTVLEVDLIGDRSRPFFRWRKASFTTVMW